MATKKKQSVVKKTAAAKAATAKPTFNAARAVQLFKSGKNVSQIAQAMGYPKGTGNNRTRNALITAGVYAKPSTGQRRATKPATPRRTTLPNLGLGIPNDPQTALMVILKTAEVTAAKLNMDEQSTSRFARTLMGMLATHFSVQDFQVRKPLLVMDADRAQSQLMKVASA